MRKAIKRIVILASVVLLMSTTTIANAEDEYNEDGIQVVTFYLKNPPPPREVETRSFDHDPQDIEILARLLWSSPLRDEEAKRDLLWVVLNRVSDESDTFGDTIAECVTVHEFSFYDRKAHLSETNLRIAQEVMDEWMSEQYGFYVGPHVPHNGLYIRFVGYNNSGIEVTSAPRGEALSW